MRQDVNTYIYVAPLSAVVAWARKIKIKRFFAVCFSISRLLHIDWLFQSLPERKPGHNCLLIVPFVRLWLVPNSLALLEANMEWTWAQKVFFFVHSIPRMCPLLRLSSNCLFSLTPIIYISFFLYAPMSTFSFTLRAIFSLRINLDRLPFAFSGDCR